MSKPANYLDILKVLPKTNCKDCGMPTCMTFAVAVMQGKKQMSDCPHLDPEVAGQLQVEPAKESKLERDLTQIVDELRAQVSKLDLSQAAERLGVPLVNGRLAVPMLGKDFYVDASGKMDSACHNILWLNFPLLNFVLHGQGRDESDHWVKIKDLKGGMDWAQFFGHRCEGMMKEVIDKHTDMFELMVDVFDARPAEAFDSDIAVKLYPLPKVPMLICYWRPDDGLGSSLNLFFDANTDKNINVESLYYLSAGMVTMFEKIALTHDR